MKLIAESGSTRTEWALVEDNHLIQRVFTEGLNPFFQTRREISRSVRLGLPEIFFKKKLSTFYQQYFHRIFIGLRELLT